MAAKNVNKFVQNNFNLKPWILSKNTSEIVSTYVKKFYKQIPSKFQNDLLKSQISAPRLENKAPIKCLKSANRFCVPIVSQVKPKLRPLGSSSKLPLCGQLLKKCTLASKDAQHKKLLKSPNFKIYGSRRYGSSASSSNASILRNFSHRNKLQQALQERQFRCIFRKLGTTSSSRYEMNSSIGKYIEPLREYEYKNERSTKALEVSSAIQQDLMRIDSLLKERISLAKRRLPNVIRENKIMKAAPMESDVPLTIKLKGCSPTTIPEPIMSDAKEQSHSQMISVQNERNRNIEIPAKVKNVEKRITTATGSAEIESKLSVTPVTKKKSASKNDTGNAQRNRHGNHRMKSLSQPVNTNSSGNSLLRKFRIRQDFLPVNTGSEESKRKPVPVPLAATMFSISAAASAGGSYKLAPRNTMRKY